MLPGIVHIKNQQKLSRGDGPIVSYCNGIVLMLCVFDTDAGYNSNT